MRTGSSAQSTRRGGRTTPSIRVFQPFKKGVFAIALGGSVVGIAIACSPSPVDVSYGNPNTLDRNNLPDKEAGPPTLACGAQTDGGGSADGGCSVSFATDIYPYMTASGAWQCTTAACHGGGSAPSINGANASDCYNSLKPITVIGKPFLPSEPGDDAGASAMLCVFQGGCATQMPKSPGVALTPTDFCKVSAWLTCGAPNN